MIFLHIASFLSGIASLNYELLWVRELSILFGSTEAAISSVLSLYFLGLAIGNYMSGKFSNRIVNPLGIFIVIEIAIGFWAFIFKPLVSTSYYAYSYSYNYLPEGSPLIIFPRILSGSVLVLVPSILMGSAIPLLVKVSSINLERGNKHSAIFYGVNTLGSVIGCIICGFFLIEKFGVTSSLYITGCINIIAALLLIPLIKNNVSGKQSEKIIKTDELTNFTKKNWLLIYFFGLMGFLNIAFEVLWVRFYSLIFHNDIYIFSIILSVHLAGIGIGSLVGIPVLKRTNSPIFIVGSLQIVSGLYSFFMTYIIPVTTPKLLASFTPSFSSLLINYFLSVVIGIFIQSVCMGACFPLLVKAVLKNYVQTAAVYGKAISWNMFGGIIGGVFAGFILLDYFGIQIGILLTAGITVALGFIICFLFSEKTKLSWIPIPSIIVPLFVILLIWPPNIPESLIALHFDTKKVKILEVKPSVHGTVAVTEDLKGERRVWINNSWIARENEHLQFGYVPWLLHPGPVNSALGICFGTGRTFGGLLNAGIPKLDLVEINSSVVDLAGKWLARSNHGIISDPRANIIIDDGRNFVKYTKNKYDLITLEPLQMFQKGVVYFYTEEFYREASERLSNGGIISQWLPLYIPDSYELKSMVKTFIKVFPNSILWGKGGNTILLGYKSSAKVIDYDIQEIYGRMLNPKVRSDLKQEGLFNKSDILAYVLLDGDGMASFSEGGKVYTDDHPTLEFTSPRKRGSVKENIRSLRPHLVSLSEMFNLENKFVIDQINRLRKYNMDIIE